MKLLAGIAVGIGIAQAAPVAGDAVYKQRCASCHEQPSTRAPQVEELEEDVGAADSAGARFRGDDDGGVSDEPR